MLNFEKILGGTVIAVALTLSGPQMGLAGFDEAVKAYEIGDFKSAYEQWLPLAENNDPAAMRNLGHLYRKGLGVDLDFEKAMSWYMRAADIGFDRAQANVGTMHLKGQGVPQSYVKASEWFAKAARNGHTISQYNLGLLYEHGKGVEKSASKALGWYNLAAKAGHPEALNKLSILVARKPSIVEEKVVAKTAAEAPKVAPDPEIKKAEKLKVKAPIVTAKPIVKPIEKTASVPVKMKPAVIAPSPKAPVKKKWDPFAGSANNLVSKGEPTVFNQKTTKVTPTEPVTVKAPVASAPVAPAIEKTEKPIAIQQAADPIVSPKIEPETVETKPDTMASKEVIKPVKAEEKGFFTALKSLLAAPPEEAVKETVVPKEISPQEAKSKSVTSTSIATITPTLIVPAPSTPVPSPPVTPVNITGSGLTLDEQMEMAELAFTLEEYQQALGVWAPLAQRGNAEAQYNLGVMFEGGYAVPVDRVRAFYWWQKAKRNGSQKAAVSLVNLENSLTYLEKKQLQLSN